MVRFIAVSLLVLSGWVDDVSARTAEDTWCGFKTARWSNSDQYTKTIFIVQFKQDGVYHYAQNSGVWTNGKWTVNGDTLELTVNNRYIVHTLKRFGDTLKGTWVNKLGHEGVVELSKSCDL